MAKLFLGIFLSIVVLITVPFTNRGSLALQAYAQYQFNRGVQIAEDHPENHAEILHWLESAADNGNAAAINEVAYIYRYGAYGRAIDMDRALELFFKAAAQGDAYAHYNLGAMYDQGLGVSPSHVKATQHFVMAAELGNPSAHLQASIRIQEGLGAKPTKQLVIRYFQQAQETEFDLRRFVGDFFHEFENIQGTNYLQHLIAEVGKAQSRPPALSVFLIAQALEETGKIPRGYSRHFTKQYDEKIDHETGLYTALGLLSGMAPPEDMIWDDPETIYAVYKLSASLGNKSAQKVLPKKHEQLLARPIPEAQQNYWRNRAAAGTSDS